MEAGVAVSAARSSFRKPSNATSQRNYRRRSPSASSRSPSGSPAPKAMSGGWKRDRSASPSSPKRDGATNASLHSKKGKTVPTGKDGSDEDSPGRLGDFGPGSSDRQARGESCDRYGRPDFYDSRRSSASHYDRSYHTHGRHTNRDSYGDTRRSGDYDYAVRNRHSPDRGYRESSRSRDKERVRSRDRDRDIEGHTRYRSRGREERETDLESKIDQDSRERHRDRDRDRDRDRNRYRERSRGRPGGRDLYLEKDDDAERRYDGGRTRDSYRERDRDRERIKSRHQVREHSVGKDFEAGEIDQQERDQDREKRRDKEKLKRKSDVGDIVDSKHLDTELSQELSGDKGVESEREKLKGKVGTSDMNVETHRDDWERTREGDKYRDRDRAGDKGGRDFSSPEMEREKDVNRIRDKGRGRDVDTPMDQDDSKVPDRRRDHSRQADGDDNYRARDFKSKEQSRKRHLKDEDEHRDRSVLRDKDEHRARDRPREKDDWVSLQDKSSSLPDNERIASKVSDTPERASHRDKDRGNTSGRGKGSGSDRRSSDASRDKEKAVVKSEKEKQPGSRLKAVDESYKSEPRDREGSKDRNHAKHDQENAQLASSLPVTARDLDVKVAAGSDGKASKGSKWGPEASDCAIKSSGSEELVNDLTVAKLAAMKAAELVNKNLGVAGFMSADQKKRLLWGSKKQSAEQEPAVAAGSNRWDTVHFSDPDRQEKFHKLMGVKAETCTESKKEEDPEVGAFAEERQRVLQQDLEKQFAAGLRRRDGGKVGLGL